MSKVLDFNLYKRVKNSVSQLDEYFICLKCGNDSFRLSPLGEAQCTDCNNFLFEFYDDPLRGA